MPLEVNYDGLKQDFLACVKDYETVVKMIAKGEGRGYKGISLIDRVQSSIEVIENFMKDEMKTLYKAHEIDELIKKYFYGPLGEFEESNMVETIEELDYNKLRDLGDNLIKHGNQFEKKVVMCIERAKKAESLKRPNDGSHQRASKRDKGEDTDMSHGARDDLNPHSAKRSRTR